MLAAAEASDRKALLYIFLQELTDSIEVRAVILRDKSLRDGVRGNLERGISLRATNTSEAKYLFHALDRLLTDDSENFR